MGLLRRAQRLKSLQTRIDCSVEVTGSFYAIRVRVRLEQDVKPPEVFALAFLLLTCTRGTAGVAFVGSHIRRHFGVFFVLNSMSSARAWSEQVDWNLSNMDSRFYVIGKVYTQA